MKKKLTIEEIEKSVANTEIPDEKSASSDKTPVKFKKKVSRKKKIRKYLILTLVALFIAAIGFFGWTLYSNLAKVFAGNDSPNLLSLFDTSKQLKGESSGRINILLLGIGDEGHDGRYLSDTMMLLSYDVKSKQVAMISIPRDTYVKIGQYGYAKINAADAYGEMYKYPGGGPALAVNTVSGILDIPIHYYARVDFTGLKSIVNTVGGVDINVEKDLYDPFYPADDGLGGKYLYIKKGMQHMDGTTALRYSRSRETTSDFDRARRQQQVLVAIRDKIMSASTLMNPQKIADIANALGTHIKTDLSVNDLPHAVSLFKGVDTSKIKNKVFDNSPEGLLIDDSSTGAGYILIPRAGANNFSQLAAVVKNIFNNNSIASENARIVVENGTTRAGLAARVADTLRNSKYNVVGVSTADSSAYSQTKIIDYTGGAKSATIAGLEKFFGVKSTKSSGGDNSSDITVIIGSDYKE